MSKAQDTTLGDSVHCNTDDLLEIVQDLKNLHKRAMQGSKTDLARMKNKLLLLEIQLVTLSVEEENDRSTRDSPETV